MYVVVILVFVFVYQCYLEDHPCVDAVLVARGRHA